MAGMGRMGKAGIALVAAFIVCIAAFPLVARGGPAVAQAPAQPAKAAVVPYTLPDKLPAATSVSCPFQDLIGKKINEVDFSAFKSYTVRIVYPDVPITNDYVRTRINIICERGSDKVLAVRCG